MAEQKPTLHMLCGKIAAGKSTLAARLTQDQNAVLIAEDEWLFTLFGEEMQNPRDYMRCAARFRAAVGPHIVSLLAAGQTVVLDFQANTVESRAWMRGLIKEAGADHLLHVLAPPDAVCLARLRARNAQGTHPFAVTEEHFHAVTKHFAPPTPEEGFTLVHHDVE